MPGRYRQLRMRDPDVFSLLPATSLAHRHARILRTFPVDLFSFCFTYPDLHHGLLGIQQRKCQKPALFRHGCDLQILRVDVLVGKVRAPQVVEATTRKVLYLLTWE